METLYYNCQYCRKEFVPKRRKIQKFCSNSCRVSFHRFKNVDVALTTTKLQEKIQTQIPSKIKVEQISGAGVANSTIGSGMVELAKSIFTPEQNKPATKGDLEKLAKILKRYHQIQNLDQNTSGHFPYFDLYTNKVVYFSFKL